MIYHSNKPVCSASGPTTRHTLAELLTSPHKEVRTGASTGRAFIFGGVVFSPTRNRPAQLKPTVAIPRAAMARFARSYCPPPSVDIVPATEEEARRNLASIANRYGEPRQPVWQFATAGLVIVALAAALGFGARTVETMAIDTWDSRSVAR
jgi:hypothetical protein